MQTQNKSKKKTTGAKKNNVARKKIVFFEKNDVASPIIHCDSSNELECAESDVKSDTEEIKYLYDNIDCNHHFSKAHDIIKYVTKETSHLMQIYEKMMDDKIYPGPEEHIQYKLLQDKKHYF